MYLELGIHKLTSCIFISRFDRSESPEVSKLYSPRILSIIKQERCMYPSLLHLAPPPQYHRNIY
jgi:hypothetical protein